MLKILRDFCTVCSLYYMRYTNFRNLVCICRCMLLQTTRPEYISGLAIQQISLQEERKNWYAWNFHIFRHSIIPDKLVLVKSCKCLARIVQYWRCFLTYSITSHCKSIAGNTVQRCFFPLLIISQFCSIHQCFFFTYFLPGNYDSRYELTQL